MEEKNNLTNNGQNKKHPHGFVLEENFTSGLLQHENEVDTDVNEDPRRERLLDESFASFVARKTEN